MKMSNESSDDWESSSEHEHELDFDQPSIKGIPEHMGGQIYKSLHSPSSKDKFKVLYLMLVQKIKISSELVPLWHYLEAEHVHLLAKQLAQLISAGEHIETNIVRKCYEIIVRISRHHRVKDKSKATFTQWVLACKPNELTDIHVIFAFLTLHDETYKLGKGPGGTGLLTNN